MAQASPLWPARLDHLWINTEDAAAMTAFYRDGLGYEVAETGAGSALLVGPERRLVIGRGAAHSLGFHAFALGDREQLERLRGHLMAAGLALEPSPSPLFGDDAFAVRDPDGGQVVFGLAEAAHSGDALPGRLQHVVVQSTGLGAMIDFYHDILGFVISDWVREQGGEATTCFLRSDPEHHSLAVFRAPQCRLDHHSYETTCWNDIRDWADHFAALRVPLSWGPGRHGPGNNLFFMVHDPDGNWVEFSAEQELMPKEMAAREWPHEERTLNSWGQGFLRS